VDEKVGSIDIEAYFRLSWHDWRLAGRKATGCAENRSHADASGMWIPDFYFTNSLKNQIGDEGGGEMVTIEHDGEVFWSVRARLTIDCAMDFWKMPWDTQRCPIGLGLYRSYASIATIEWKDGSAITWDSQGKMAFWTLGKSESFSEIVAFSSGSYAKATAFIVLDRKSSSLVSFVIIVALLFVFASWMGFYINAAAAPARVALGFLCFLCVMNNISAVRAAVRWGADDALRTPSTQSFETHAHKHCLLACALKTFLARDLCSSPRASRWVIAGFFCSCSIACSSISSRSSVTASSTMASSSTGSLSPWRRRQR